MPHRASTSDGSAYARRMYRATSRAPSSASASEAGVASRQCSESTACDSASMPAAAVTRGRAGQRQVRVDQRDPRAVAHVEEVHLLLAHRVSDDGGRADLAAGSRRGRDRDAPAADRCRSAPKSSQSRGCPPLVSSRPMHLAVSIADPPPTATSARCPPDLIRSAPARQSVSLRIRLDLVEYRDREPAAGQRRSTGATSPAAAHAGVGDHARPCSRRERRRAPRPARRCRGRTAPWSACRTRRRR